MSEWYVRRGLTPAERCRYVADLIEAHPKNFDMKWFYSGFSGVVVFERGDRPDPTQCGTTCCIAGWAVIVTPPDESTSTDIEYDADNLLALGGDGSTLFYDPSLTAADAAFLLRWHADKLDRQSVGVL